MAETERHQKVMMDYIDILRRHFRGVPDVHVGGNLLLYYEENNPRKWISPDVFMVRGVSKKELRVYKTWEQQPTLDFVLEVASPSTVRKDLGAKKDLYANVLEVKEYYIYDPYHEIEPSFIGFRLVGDMYEEIGFVEGRLPSKTLGLELGEHKDTLRLYDVMNGRWLPTSDERADAAETRAAAAETELAELRATLERFQTSE
jgi:hypothetical protein